MRLSATLPQIDPDKPVLIAGPTASGKSALALEIATTQGGVIVNADASQVYDCWRIITARPSAEEEALAPHRLYGHLPYDAEYSAGHWLREVLPLLKSGPRPIIVGGTGLYFSALTQGLADIPATPPEVRAAGDALSLEDIARRPGRADSRQDRPFEPRPCSTSLGGFDGHWARLGRLASGHTAAASVRGGLHRNRL